MTHQNLNLQLRTAGVQLSLVTSMAFLTLLSAFSCELTDYSLSIVFVFLFLKSTYLVYISSEGELSLPLVFTLTFGLFVGGRFFSYILGYEKSPFISTFFLSYALESGEKLNLVIKCLLFIVPFSIACGFFKIDSFSKHKVNSTDFSLFVGKCGIIVFPFILIFYLNSLYTTLGNAVLLGYNSLYASQGAEVEMGGAIASFLNVLLLFFLGYAVSNSDNTSKYLYFGLFIAIAATYLFVGARAKFGASILLLVWLYYKGRKVSVPKMFSVGLISILSVIILSSLSLRFEDGNTNSNLIDSVLEFIYSQGVTLMVIDLASKVDNYPALAYVQMFLPASSTISSFLTDVQRYETSFGNYLAYSIDKNMYYNGNGLGWSIVMDAYLLSGRYSILIPAYGVGAAYLMSLLSKLSLSSVNYYALFIMIFSKIIYSPRSSLNSVIPMVVWFFVFWVILAISYEVVCRVGGRRKNI